MIIKQIMLVNELKTINYTYTMQLGRAKIFSNERSSLFLCIICVCVALYLWFRKNVPDEEAMMIYLIANYILC